MAKSDTVKITYAGRTADRAFLNVRDKRTKLVDLVAETCQRLDLDPFDVAALHIEPDQVTATVFLKNENGKKYIDHKTEVPAMGFITKQVRA